MPDFNFESPHSRRPPPSDTFWTDVWKIALGIFLGSVISFLFCGLITFLATLVWQAVNAPRAPAPERATVITIDEINAMILEYKELTAADVSETEKAIAAGQIARAFRDRKDRKNLAEWEEKVRRHRAAAETGKKTNAVR